MAKYFLGFSELKSSWDQVFSAFWQRYPNPYSKHVLSEDILYREVTSDHKLLTRRLLTKTNRLPRWAERFFPANVANAVYVIEDSIMDCHKRTLTTYTWNINHSTIMSVEERCIYCKHSENWNWTEIKREAWVSSKVFGFSRPIQEFGLARFKSNVTKAIKGFEFILAKLQGPTPLLWHLKYSAASSETLVCGMLTSPATDYNVLPGESPARTLVETAKEATEKAKEKAKDLANKAATSKKKHYV